MEVENEKEPVSYRGGGKMMQSVIITQAMLFRAVKVRKLEK